MGRILLLIGVSVFGLGTYLVMTENKTNVLPKKDGPPGGVKKEEPPGVDPIKPVGEQPKV